MMTEHRDPTNPRTPVLVETLRHEPPHVRGRSTLVLVERLELAEESDLLLMAIEGSHFLWKMVRRIVGVLVEIGRGRLEPDATSALLAAPSSPLPARLTAPASGLFLEQVRYKGDARLATIAAATPLRADVRA